MSTFSRVISELNIHIDLSSLFLFLLHREFFIGGGGGWVRGNSYLLGSKNISSNANYINLGSGR